VSAFVRDLRKNLLHGSVVVPGWEVSSDQDSRYGKLKLSVWELLEIGKWTKESVNFLNKSPDKTIDLRKTIDAYNQKLNKYSRFISNVLAVNVTTAERDYFDIVDECSRLAKRQWFKIVAQILKGKNPYDYLHYTFQDYEVRQIMRLPRNSRQQIDLIISLKSAEVECDEELRRSLYHLFQVSDT
jgi:ribosomal protein S17